MNKADSAKKTARSEKIVKYLSITFIVTFIACAAFLGLPNTGLYSVLWFIGLTLPFNYGGRVMSKQVRDEWNGRSLSRFSAVYDPLRPDFKRRLTYHTHITYPHIYTRIIHPPHRCSPAAIR